MTDEIVFEHFEDHGPTQALPVLSSDYWMLGIGRAIDNHMSLVFKVCDGYVYAGLDPSPRERGPRPAAPSNLRQKWDEQLWPELRGIYDEMDAADLSGKDAPEVWNAQWDRMVRAWDIHFETVFNAWAPLETFANTYVSLLGGSRADAAALIHGFSETTQRLETDLRTLTAVAAASPEDARLLAESPPRVRAPGRFADALADFLTEHGHMGHNCMLDTAPWDEDPAPLLNEIAKRLADERPRPGGRDPMQVRVDLARRGLSEPDRAQFDQALEVALRDGSLTEEHATYIDQMLGQRMRRLVMKAARRLTEAGVLDDERDVVHLHHDEVARLLTEPVDMRALVAERRLQLEEWRRTRPAKRLGGVVEQAAPPPADGILSGVAASPGTARGPAKVVLGHDAFEKVRPGDVMVCKSTHPAFTPVMAISAAVVTSSGDLFSHAAVESRELGIPAVVGVAGACDVIAEGRMVEVDGDAGVVRLL